MSNINCDTLLKELPPYKDQWIVISDRQSVNDIIFEVLAAHKEFSPDYDNIALFFDGDTNEEICSNIYDFLKTNIVYKEEPEERQTTALPAGILTRRCGDCKHYSELAGGILNGINRLTGKKIKWCYRFASYHTFSKTPHHVFVVVFEDDGSEIWIDPTPGSAQHIPVWQIDKKINSSGMPLLRNIAGFNNTAETIVIDEGLLPRYENEVLSPDVITRMEEQQAADEVTPELQSAIEILMTYGVMNDEGEISDKVLQNLSSTLPQDQFDQVSNARAILQFHIEQGAALGNIFSDIWRGVKKVALAAPRNAYLGLVALNVFGYATKLYNSIFKPDGSYFQPNQDDLYQKWHSLGGDWQNLLNAINSGHTKNAILAGMDSNAVGVAPAAAAPAWLALAAGIIAALAPLIKSMIDKKNAAGMLAPGIDPSTGLPYGMNNMTAPTGGGGMLTKITDFVKQNPMEVALIGVGGYFLFFDKKKR